MQLTVAFLLRRSKKSTLPSTFPKLQAPEDGALAPGTPWAVKQRKSALLGIRDFLISAPSVKSKAIPVTDRGSV